MNLCRFIDLLTPDVRWWICKTICGVLNEKSLINPHTHAMYIDIACNHKENMIAFLDAEIVLRCLEERIGKDKDYHEANLVDLVALMHYLKEALEEENYEPPPTVGKYSEDDMMVLMSYEQYEEPRVFLDDPHVKGIRTKYEG